MKWFGVIGAFVLLGLAAGAGWYQWRDHSQDQAILLAAAKYRVDAALVKAVVWRESRFDPQARGRAGEIGLMQIREIAAQEWADAERLNSFAHEQLVDPGTNAMAGAWLLGKLLKRYSSTDNPLPYALADYNAGRSHVLRWNRETARTNSATFMRQISFPGTKLYVESVIQRYELYRPWSARAAKPAGSAAER